MWDWSYTNLSYYNQIALVVYLLSSDLINGQLMNIIIIYHYMLYVYDCV